MVYAALQILYPRFLAVQNFVRFVCFFLCEKQVSHILLQLLVGLGITPKTKQRQPRKKRKSIHTHTLCYSVCLRVVAILSFFIRWNRNETNPILFLPLIWYYVRISLRNFFCAFCLCTFFIYFLSLFYIYQPKRFADRNVFLSSSFPSAFLR